MRRRHVDEPRVVRQPFRDESLGIDRHADHRRAERRERGARGRIAGVLDRDDVARPHDDAREQVERLLRALRDEHVVPAAGDRAAESRIARDRAAQLRIAGRIVVLAGAARLLAQRVMQAAPPCVEREQRLVGYAAAKVEAGRILRRGHRERVGQVVPQRARIDRIDARPLVDDRRRRSHRGVRHAREAVGDERAVAGARSQVALGHQALECVERRLARHAELFREIARRRQPRTAFETPVDDRGAQLPEDLPRQVVTAFDADRDVHRSGYLDSCDFASISIPELDHAGGGSGARSRGRHRAIGPRCAAALRSTTNLTAE